MLAISFISAVNRKRKKRREARGLGSSTDDDSEQEALKPGAGTPAPCSQDPPEGPLPGAVAPEAPGRLSPPAAREERLAADTRSIVSGYSTLSTMDRSVCSGAGGRRAGAGDEADDERSELSHVETDTEGGAGPGARLARRPSFTSHHLMPCDTLARRRLARSRPDGEAAGRAGPRVAEPPGSASSSSQESLRPPAAAAMAALGARPSRLEALRLRLRGTADDMLAVRLRRPLSPETRRRRSSWRRHTVVVQSPLTDLNFNEWKELGGGCPSEPAGARALSDNKDSGLSSLESTKARAASSAASLPPAPGAPGALQSQPPRRPAARLHQCL